MTPMIEVEELTRAYGSTLAVDRVSFSVEAGELVGFLGKNGAGKTTTLRMLAGSLAPTDGAARIDGFDVDQDPRAVKARVGYLPEIPPLYLDMTARAYLRYAARLKGVQDPRAAVERAIEQVRLGENAGRLIAHLSKGYRQRVGIAQAIVHHPRVLLLDEPLSGLDPAQRREIRDLVAELAAGDTTVLLSTHVLAEIEAVCDRVLVLHQGRLVAMDALADLAGAARRVSVVVARPDPRVRAALAAVDGVVDIEEAGPGRYTVHAARDIREALAAAAVSAGLLELRGLDGLEEAFLRLTGDAAPPDPDAPAPPEGTPTDTPAPAAEETP